MRTHLASAAECGDITRVLVEKIVDVIAAEIARGHTVVLCSRAYAERQEGKSVLIGRHVIRTIGTFHGSNLGYSARRDGRAEAGCDVAVAEYGDVLDEAGEL